MLSQEGRCLKCFEEISLRKGTCKSCRNLVHPFRQMAACFDSFSPAKMLLHALENKQHFLCAKDIAAFMMMQIDAFNWPIPDLVVPLPQHFSRSTQMIAKALSGLLQCRLEVSLRKKWELSPQFILKKKCNIYRQRVLLLTTEMESCTSMRTAARVLEEGGPLEIYGMAFCIV